MPASAVILSGISLEKQILMLIDNNIKSSYSLFLQSVCFPLIILLFSLIPDYALTQTTHPGDVVAEIPDFGNDRGGLAFDGQYVWQAARDLNTIYQIDPATSSTVHSIPTPADGAAGLHWENGKLWQLDMNTKKMYRLNPADGAVEIQWPVHGVRPLGISVFKDKIYVSDRYDSSVHVYDAMNGDRISTRTAPKYNLWGATHDDRYLWFAGTPGYRVFAVEPERWELVGWIVTNAGEISGVASDGDGIWVYDHKKESIRKHLVKADQSWAILDDWGEKLWVRAQNYWNNGNVTIEEFETFNVLPGDRINQKPQIESALFTLTPSEDIYVDEYGTRFLPLLIENIPPGDYFDICSAVPVMHGTIVYTCFPHLVGTVNDIPQDFRDEWTSAVRQDYSMDDAFVQNAAVEAAGEETNVFWMVMSIHDYVCDNITYGKPAWNRVKVTLETGIGVCADYAKTMVSLCRLNGIPARQIGGMNHITVEVWLPGYDCWFPIDPSGNDTKNPASYLYQNRHNFGKLFRIIDGMGSRPDHGVWRPHLTPSDASYKMNEFRAMYQDWDANHPPVFTGHQESPFLSGKRLLLKAFPAFDPDGDDDISYRGYFTGSEDESTSGTADFVTDNVRGWIDLEKRPSQNPLFLRLVPFDEKGAEEHRFHVRSEWNFPVTIGNGKEYWILY